MNICFEFLQVAVGTRACLPRSLEDKDWYAFYEFCRRQALLGVGFSAVERMHEQGIECPYRLRMQWMSLALKIEEMNRNVNIQCRELTERLEHDGLQCCILKGQSHQLVYPEGVRARRNPGDIDVWCRTPENGLKMMSQTLKGYETYHGDNAIREYVRRKSVLAGMSKMPKACYHHIDAPNIGCTHVEVHYRPSFLHSPVRNIRLQRYFSLHAKECMRNMTSLGFSMPTSSVNVVYQMCHLFSHIFETGLGLRQLLDYYFTLKAWNNNYESRIGNCDLSAKADEELSNDKCFDPQKQQSQGMWAEGLGVQVMSKEKVMRVLRSFGMGKFVGAVMWVLHEVFAMPTHYYICEPNEKEGRKLLAEIMQGGNFGQYYERGKDMRNGGTIPHAIWKLKHVMRLVSSYPEEALCEPFFRVWHWGWRVLHR